MLLAALLATTVLAADPVDLVDPLIGTDDMGHTYPGATVPFGLVQLSPQTRLVPYSFGEGYNPETYRYCSGYQYADSTITGFAHTHFNGTGHSDLGDLLMMPTIGELDLEDYASQFSHERETAAPGSYRVHLDDYGIEAELTATERVGVHRYTFPASDEAHLILDLTANIYDYPGKTVWSSVRMENDRLLTGYRRTSGWARSRVLFFAIEFSKPVESYGLRNFEEEIYRGFWRRFDQDLNFPERAGRQVKCHFDWDMGDGEQLVVKVAVSSVSTDGALKNLEAEATGRTFDEIRESASDAWNRQLARARIEADEDVLTSYYTALYHTMMGPVVHSDVDGQYRGLDENIHTAEGFTNYTIFSLWDTYRAQHPLLTILHPDRASDMVRSMMAHADQSVHGVLPVWSHHANENWCMIGYHAVSVIADAYLKGIGGFDADHALDAMVASANFDLYDGIPEYRTLGWVPADQQSSAASKTLEFAYDDWVIARMASQMGREETAAEFDRRATSWRNLHDPQTNFLRARNADGTFPGGFDAMATHGQGYIEGNAWNYSLYVPHDVDGFITTIGGPEVLVDWLDGLFEMEVDDESIAHTEDVTRAGMIGNYVHGNEPSHHVPYMYVWADRPDRTQERVRQIMREMYRPYPDGLCGNDDVGQMSSWYVFSALGFYPVAPGSNEYVLGSPAIERAQLDVGRGREFRVIVQNQSLENVYVQQVFLDGKALDRQFIRHEEVMNGGELRFVMDREPASSSLRKPYSMNQ
jgi:predicted alpha-1,2-mannosidase